MDFRAPAEEALGLAPEGKYHAFIDDVAPWLKGMNWESFRADAKENIDKMDLISYAEALADKPIMTVTGTLDTLLAREEHIDRLNAAIASCGKGKLTAKVYETDHAFNMHRPEIRQDVIDFLKANVS